MIRESKLSKRFKKYHSHLKSPGLLKGAMVFIIIVTVLSYLPNEGGDLKNIKTTNNGGALAIVLIVMYNNVFTKLFLHLIPIWLIISFLIRNRNDVNNN